MSRKYEHFTGFDQYFQISRGLVPGLSAFGAAGVNRDVDLGVPEDVWSAGGLFPYLSSAQPLECLSDSASDTAAGTGARTVTVTGLDQNWEQRTDTLTLAGTIPVVSPSPFLRVLAFRCASAGSAGGNVGNLTLRASPGGATQSFVRAGDGQALSALFSVPAGHTAFLLDAFVAVLRAGANEYVEFALKARGFGGPWITRNVFSASANGTSSFNIAPRVIGALAEKSDIRFSVDSVSANNTMVQATMLLILQKN